MQATYNGLRAKGGWFGITLVYLLIINMATARRVPGAPVGTILGRPRAKVTEKNGIPQQQSKTTDEFSVDSSDKQQQWNPIATTLKAFQSKWENITASIDEDVKNRERRRFMQNFLRLRTGYPELKYAIWHYTGVIRNPLTGSEVVAIQGVEIVRGVGLLSAQRYEGQLLNDTLSPLAADRIKLTSALLGQKGSNNPTGGSNKHEAAVLASYLVKKAFIYTEVANRTKAVTGFRVRPQAPLRAVEPAKQFTELVTISCRPGDKRQIAVAASGATQGAVTGDDEYTAVIQWPGGRTVGTRKIKLSSTLYPTQQSQSQQERTNRAPHITPLKWAASYLASDKPGTPHRYDVISFISGGSGIKKLVPKWISFAPSDTDNRGRSQEYYSLSMSPRNKWAGVLGAIPVVALAKFTQKAVTSISSSGGNHVGHSTDDADSNKGSIGAKGAVTMQYKRYGECPPWYSVGRFCSTELTATRYSTVQALPSDVRLLVERECPGFFTRSNLPTLASLSTDIDLLKKFKPWYDRILGR
jgi:hypothetical protein